MEVSRNVSGGPRYGVPIDLTHAHPLSERRDATTATPTSTPPSRSKKSTKRNGLSPRSVVPLKLLGGGVDHGDPGGEHETGHRAVKEGGGQKDQRRPVVHRVLRLVAAGSGTQARRDASKQGNKRVKSNNNKITRVPPLPHLPFFLFIGTPVFSNGPGKTYKNKVSNNSDAHGHVPLRPRRERRSLAPSIRCQSNRRGRFR